MEEESIYKLIPEAQRVVKKAPRYKSKHQPTAPPTGSTFGGVPANYGGGSKSTRAAQGGWGPKKLAKDTVNPKSFLKKTEKKLPPASKFSYNDRRKPALDLKPSSKTASVRSGKTKKNFLRENKRAPVRKRTPAQPTDLDYRHKADYGKVPEYLQHVKAAVEQEKEEVRRVLHAQEEQQQAAASVHQLSDEERTKLLEGLKKKYDEVNRQYQGMTHITDMRSVTLRKKQLKQDLEAQLEELEKAIDKLSHGTIFVKD